jgi:hypothetical protein
MRKQNTLVFNDFVYAPSTSPIYTDAEYNDLLGRFDQTSIFAVADSATGSSPTLTIQIMQSPDGRNWLNKNISAELNGGISATGT